MKFQRWTPELYWCSYLINFVISILLAVLALMDYFLTDAESPVSNASHFGGVIGGTLCAAMLEIIT